MRGSSASRMIVGLAVVVLGLLLLLDSLDVTGFGSVLRWTPSLFILLGVWRLVAGGFRRVAGPLFLIAVATAVQLLVLDVISGDTLWDLWPLLIIMVGVSVLVGRTGRRRRARATARPTRGEGEGRVDLTAVFSGVSQRVTAPSFRGGQITAVFGGAEIDLRGTAVDDRPATLDVTVVFGAAELKVPTHWRVDIEATVLFGGSEDERRSAASGAEGPPDLVVTGLVLFGAIEIKD